MPPRLDPFVRTRRHATALVAAFLACPWVASCHAVAAAEDRPEPEAVSTEETAPPEVSRARAREEQRADLLEFASAVSQALGDHDATPPPNNTYSHETAYGPWRVAEPRIRLEPSSGYSILTSTDCSGWITFVVNTVSPLHHAVLQSQRHRPEYNHTYEDGFSLHEGRRPWARAFVLTNFFGSEHASRSGFEHLHGHRDVRYGDLVAYSLGRYTDLTNAELPRPPDTGHTFLVAGPASVVDPDTPDYDARGTLSEQAIQVLAIPIIDSSAVPHFDPDTRKDAEGRFSLPARMPHPRARAGGIGMGTAWFALDADERVIQRRLGPDGDFRDVVISAVRLVPRIALTPEILDEDGLLVVDGFGNTPTEYAGASYGDLPVDLTGDGGIRLVGGRLVLAGDNTFTGGVRVEGGTLEVASSTALGTGDLEVHGGRVRFQQAALPDGSVLRLSEEVQDRAVQLGFEGQDVVGSLQIGDVEYRCGRWGSLDSDATHRDPRFAGEGELLLVGGAPDECAADGAR